MWGNPFGWAVIVFGSSACLRSLSRHRAVADHEKNQDEKEYPDRAGEVSLIEISHLRPRTPSFTAIRKDRLKIVPLMGDRLNSRRELKLACEETGRKRATRKRKRAAIQGVRLRAN